MARPSPAAPVRAPAAPVQASSVAWVCVEDAAASVVRLRAQQWSSCVALTAAACIAAVIDLRALDVEACAADGLADTTSARASSRTPCNAAWTLAESSPLARRRRRSSGLLPRDGGRAGAEPQRNYTWSQRARRRVSARCRCHARADVTARRGRAAWKRATGGAQWPRRRLAAALSTHGVEEQRPDRSG
jgi:hypothetical protein